MSAPDPTNATPTSAPRAMPAPVVAVLARARGPQTISNCSVWLTDDASDAAPVATTSLGPHTAAAAVPLTSIDVADTMFTSTCTQPLPSAVVLRTNAPLAVRRTGAPG